MLRFVSNFSFELFYACSYLLKHFSRREKTRMHGSIDGARWHQPFATNNPTFNLGIILIIGSFSFRLQNMSDDWFKHWCVCKRLLLIFEIRLFEKTSIWRLEACVNNVNIRYFRSAIMAKNIISKLKYDMLNKQRSIETLPWPFWCWKMTVTNFCFRHSNRH